MVPDSAQPSGGRVPPDGRDPAPPYEVHVSAFEGPLDLLLQLVERNDLPITQVSLAAVTDQYLQRMRHMDVPAEELSHFLVVASRLLLIKSRSLLPRAPSETAEPTGEELAEQVRAYRRFRAAAVALRELDGRVGYLQLQPPPTPAPTASFTALPPEHLRHAYRRTVARRRTLPQGPPVPRQRFRLADALARGERLLVRGGGVSLQEIAGGDAGRGELVVAFLAVLELVRRGRARAEQEHLFGPMLLYALAAEEVH